MNIDPFAPIRQLEEWISQYTGAPYVVTTHRCMSALTMVCEYLKVRGDVSLPRYTYHGLTAPIYRSGARAVFHNRSWRGAYRLDPYPIWDSARRFTSGMYLSPGMWGEYVCVSFHSTKILRFTEGGAILTDDEVAAEWFREARDYGRPVGKTPKETTFRMIGYDYYMTPYTAAGLLLAAHHLPMHNEDLPNNDYADLSLTNWDGLWKRQRERESTESVSI